MEYSSSGSPKSLARRGQDVFEVRCLSPLDEEWESRDKKIYEAAGRRSDAAGTTEKTQFGRLREHWWVVGSFARALKIKRRLQQIDGAHVTIKEQ